MKSKKIPPEFEITELFLVKAGNDYKRTFVGQIHTETTKEGKSIVRGSVEVTDGKLWSVAESDSILGKYLDDLCAMKLDMGLHSNPELVAYVSDSIISLN
jgi:hypothetical protein